MALVKGGADLEGRDVDGNTAVMHAVERRRPKVVDFLRRAGSKLTAANAAGETALQFMIADAVLDPAVRRSRCHSGLFESV